jgi:alpha-glucosidase
MPRPQWDGETLLFRGDEGALDITPLSDDVVRVRLTRAKSFGRDHSYAVANRNVGGLEAKVIRDRKSTTLQTRTLRVLVQHDPIRISFADSSGRILDADDPERGIAFAGCQFRVAKRLLDDEHVYGFGEKNGRLDKRGWKLGGYNYVMWNSDTWGHDPSTDPIYVSVPFYLVMRSGAGVSPASGQSETNGRDARATGAHGLFLDNTWRSSFDIGREQPNLLTFGAVDGELDYYFINGPEPKKVIERYTALTGRMPLPPLWSLGFHQSRYSYYPESQVRRIAETFREKKMPADVIWLDIHYQDGFKPFTWDKERFPDPKKMISDLRTQNFRVVCIVDAHPKKEKGYAPYDEGIAGNHFVRKPDGSIYEAPVWPSYAEKDPGPSVFPDFSNPATRIWWGSLYKPLVDIGVAGIWNDMNEPAVFRTDRATMPPDVVFNNERQPSTHLELHNVYGQLMSRSTFEGLSRLYPNERPFVLTRASFAGGQRYAAVWTGDNTSDWASLRQSIPTLLGLGLSGFPFVGADIGGYAGMPSGELHSRWMQLGVFTPFMRAHSEINRPDKEPWSFGERYEAINRRAIELRYELLPTIYNVMKQSSDTGLPAMRPLFLEFPGDEKVAGRDDEFLFGENLLVAPVLHEGETNREVYLPKGDWYDYWTGKRHAGGASIRVPVTQESLPIFVREGAFVFRQPVVQSTGEMPGKPLHVLVAPANESGSVHYEDDGATLGYRSGEFMKRSFRQVRRGQQVTIQISQPEGSYRPATRDLVLEVWSEVEPKGVQEGVDSRIALPRVGVDELAATSSGWAFTNGFLRVKSADRWAALLFKIE